MEKPLLYSLVIVVILFNVRLGATQMTIGNCTATEFSIPITTSNWRMIFIFNCRPITPFNPPFPDYYITQATKYNELDLSPNFFTQLPLATLCQFKYTTSLDMSHNYLGSLRNAFVDLRCLSTLSHIDFSYNLISTPLLASDFDDAFASQIGSINLTGNLIPAVESRAFLRLDGSSRFPELTYLGLAHNRIRDFDLLWPLTLPSPILNIDLKINPITRLVNQFGFGYSNDVFRFNMTGYRHVDITTNSLQYLDDSNMLQYGLLNENDMRDFLIKISNYDFRQSNLVRTFICYCPSYGLNTVRWYKMVANQLDTSLPIFQLFCKEFPNLVYVFNFPCNDSKTVTTQTTSTTTTTTTEEVFSTSQTQSSLLFSFDKKQQFLKDNAIDSTADSQTNPNLIYLLFLLLIPFVLLIVLMFICCCGRCCQVHSNFLFCPCMRPNDRSLFSGKTYDVVICYNRFDETWVDEELVSEIMKHENRYRIQKLSLSGRPSVERIGRDSERILRSTKRIVLVFTQDFAEDDFKNRSFLALLKELAQTDPNCVVVAINKGLDSKVFHYCVDYLDSPTRDSRSFEKSGYYEKMSACSRLTANVKYHCGLRDVEKLDFNSDQFHKYFFFTLPFLDFDNVTSEAPKKGKLDYPTDCKDPKKLRHIVIPIPEFMKTKLGGFSASRLKSNKTHHRNDTTNDDNDDSDYYSNKNRRLRAASNSTRSTNTTSYAAAASVAYQQQDHARDLFTSMPAYSNRTNNYNESNELSTAATNAYLHRHTALFASSGQRTREPINGAASTSLAMIKSTSSYQEVDASLNIRQPQRRCETPDILALFAPKPDQVIELNGNRTSSSQASSNSNNKRRPSSRPVSRENNSQQPPQPLQRSSSSSKKIILQGSSNSAYDNNEVDA